MLPGLSDTIFYKELLIGTPAKKIWDYLGIIPITSMVMMIMVKTLRRAVCSGSQACNTSLPLPRQHCSACTLLTLKRSTVKWQELGTRHRAWPGKAKALLPERRRNWRRRKSWMPEDFASSINRKLWTKSQKICRAVFIPIFSWYKFMHHLYTTEPAAAHQTSWSSLLVSCFLQQWCRLPSSFQCRNHHHFQPANFSPTFLSFPSLLFGI